jgi:hypothetical protein
MIPLGVPEMSALRATSLYSIKAVQQKGSTIEGQDIE